MDKIIVLLLNDFQKTTLRYALYQAIVSEGRPEEYYYTDEERAVMVNIHNYLAKDSDIPF